MTGNQNVIIYKVWVTHIHPVDLQAPAYDSPPPVQRWEDRRYPRSHLSFKGKTLTLTLSKKQNKNKNENFPILVYALGIFVPQTLCVEIVAMWSLMTTLGEFGVSFSMKHSKVCIEEAKMQDGCERKDSSPSEGQ